VFLVPWCFAAVKFLAYWLEDKPAGLAESDRGLSKAVRKGEMRNKELSPYLRGDEYYWLCGLFIRVKRFK
jgi:hypothetical protein